MAKKLSLLNKNQRKWLNNFLEGKPYARLTNVYDSLNINNLKIYLPPLAS